ncbi:MAG: cell division protein FtsA [bacterium]
MSQKISVGIDIGTYQIKVVVSESILSKDGTYVPKIVAVGEAESKGLRHGYIINIFDVTRCIKLAVSQAEKIANIKIKKGYISIGGIGLSSVIGKGSVMITKADLEITNLDVKNVLAEAENSLPSSLLINKQIIQTIPQAFKIDGQMLIGRPVGMYGSKFEAKVLFIVCLKQHLNDIIKAVENAGIEVLDIIASPIAASMVSLTKIQKIAGCILVNIGSETVSFAVFENNIPISLEVFPIGSTDITNDIALGFKISIDEAENIKLKRIGEIQFSKKKLDEIIIARLSDIFDLIEAHLKKIGRSGLLPAGIILTGGGSGIDIIEDIAKISLKLPSKISSINFLSNIKNSQLQNSYWSVAYGLSVWGLNLNETDDFIIGFNSVKQSGKNIFNEIFDWVKQFLP